MGNFDRLLQSGRGFACAIYKAQPGALIPNPVSDILKLAWDGLCGDDDPANLPPPPVPPFQGGQCVCVKYRVSYIASGGGLGNTSTVRQVDVYGPISAIKLVSVPEAGVTRVVIVCRGDARGVCQPASFDFMALQFGTAGNPPPSLSTQSVVRLDGQPDNCGNLPGTYPSSPPPPSGGYVSPFTVINYNDNTSYSVVFNLKPPTDFSDGIPDICITANIQGVNQKICFPFGSSPRLENLLIGDPQLTEILDELREFKKDYDFDSDPPSYENSGDVDSRTTAPGQEGEEDIDSLLGVKVTLTKYPQDSQFGTPNVYFAGWLTFKIQGGYEMRHPIHFEESYFAAPPGATGYAYTFTKGAEGTTVAYSKTT